MLNCQLCRPTFINGAYFVSSQKNSYSISHTVTTQWLDSDGAVTVANCQQHRDYIVDQQLYTQKKYFMFFCQIYLK